MAQKLSKKEVKKIPAIAYCYAGILKDMLTYC